VKYEKTNSGHRKIDDDGIENPNSGHLKTDGYHTGRVPGISYLLLQVGVGIFLQVVPDRGWDIYELLVGYLF
jgi:hypothetical protein